METSPEVARPMGSTEGFGSGGAVVGEVRLRKGSCSSGGKKDVNVPTPSFWRKIPDSEVRVEVQHPSSLHSHDVVNRGDSENMNSHSPTLDLDTKPALRKSGKMIRRNSGCTKRSGMAHTEVSKNKSGVHDANGFFPELPSSSASCNVSEKNPMVKQKNSSTSRRGDKRNNKANHKSRCDSFSLKNGLLGFNSAAGGNNFIGLCGSKSDVFDITKYADEPSLDELLRGSYSCPFMKDKEKATTNSNSNVLQSVRSACSILQAQRVLQVQNSSETDINSIRKDSIGAVGQTDSSKGDSRLKDLPSLEKVHKSDAKIKTLDSVLYKPKDMLVRLALSAPKDLDVLLSDASKPMSSKYITDPRLGKQPISQRTGLPPFPWSHSFSGHNKLGSDAVKLSMSRTVCQGRWAKVENCIALQKGSADLLKDFESLKFDQSLVPSISKHLENQSPPLEGALSASVPTSSRKVSADEYSIIHAAAQTLLDMSNSSNKNRNSLVKLLKKPSQMSMKASKSKATDRSEISFQAPKSAVTMSQHNPSKACDDRFSSKKLKLSPADTSTSLPPYMAGPVRKSTLDPSSSLPSVKSPPPRKLFRDPNANTDSYGTNLVKKPCVTKTPRGADRAGGSSSKPKSWKSSQ